MRLPANIAGVDIAYTRVWCWEALIRKPSGPGGRFNVTNNSHIGFAKPRVGPIRSRWV